MPHVQRHPGVKKVLARQKQRKVFLPEMIGERIDEGRYALASMLGRVY